MACRRWTITDRNSPTQIQEPARALPLVAVGLYVPIVFFSNGILPGPDATQLGARPLWVSVWVWV